MIIIVGYSIVVRHCADIFHSVPFYLPQNCLVFVTIKWPMRRATSFCLHCSSLLLLIPIMHTHTMSNEGDNVKYILMGTNAIIEEFGGRT